MQIVAIVVQALVGLGFLLAGGPKFANTKQTQQQRDHLGIVPWFWRLTGGLEILGAIGLFVGIWYPLFAIAGGLLLGATMIGAFFTHVMHKDSFSHMLPAIVLFVLIVIILVVRLPQMMSGSL
jgi:putative oxidoreductase